MSDESPDTHKATDLSPAAMRAISPSSQEEVNRNRDIALYERRFLAGWQDAHDGLGLTTPLIPESARNAGYQDGVKAAQHAQAVGRDIDWPNRPASTWPGCSKGPFA